MRHTWVSHVATSLAAAALMTACSRDVGNSGAVKDQRTDAGGRVDQIVALTGCVQGAADPNEFVLRNVQLEPPRAQPTDSATSAATTVTEGSTVRLRIANSDELKKHLGQVVSVTGTITDDGRSTIGTGGRPRDPGQAEAPTDASRAAAPEPYPEKQAQEAGPLGLDSMANGTAPRMSVEKVTPRGERCNLAARPESRGKSGSDKPSGSSSQSK
jgi:hypothetical protein